MRIVAPNYFQTPNDLVDHWLRHLKGGEIKVLLVILRYTFGWHKVRDRISLSQFQEATGMSRWGVVCSIKSLVQKGIILKETVGKNGTQESYYELIVDDNSNNSDQSQPPTPPSLNPQPPPVSNLDPQKKLLNKDTKETTTKKAAPSVAAPLKTEKRNPTEHKIIKNFYPCLENLGLSNSEITSLIQDYDEETIIQAVKVVTAPGFLVKKKLIAALLWACKNKIPVSDKPEEKEQKNKDFATKMLRNIRKGSRITMEVLNKFVEFVIPNGSGGTAEAIYYTENGFEEQLKCKLKKFNLLLQ